MNSEISMKDMLYFKTEYENNKENVDIQNKIRKFGIKNASIDKDIESKIEFKFNIEIPETKIYNQHNSSQCNIYAFLRVVKSIMQKNSSLDINNLDLSATYISFFDKLEKINSLYNDLISCDDLSLDIINNKVNRYIGVYGTFHFARGIVNKYGLVLTKNMEEVKSNYDEFLVVKLLKNKIKSDALELINIKDINERRTKKKKLMSEAYSFLSKVLGNVPTSFEFNGEILTPIEFKNKYLNSNLEDYVTVTTFNKDALFNSYAFIPNVYLNDNENIITVTPSKAKDAIVKQLKDGIGVWFSSEESTTLDYDCNILDESLYNYHDMLNIKKIPKNKRLSLDIINYDHAMCITGALVLDGEIKQFKVDNSFGKHGKFNGYLIMTNSFFDNYVITSIINKKYLK